MENINQQNKVQDYLNVSHIETRENSRRKELMRGTVEHGRKSDVSQVPQLDRRFLSQAKVNTSTGPGKRAGQPQCHGWRGSVVWKQLSRWQTHQSLVFPRVQVPSHPLGALTS